MSTPSHNNLNIEAVLSNPDISTAALEEILSPFFPLSRPRDLSAADNAKALPTNLAMLLPASMLLPPPKQ